MTTFYSQPNGKGRVETHNRGSRIIHARGIVDRTRRPRRPNVPRFWPADVPFPPPPRPKSPQKPDKD
jgi:hypothetical protein